MRNRTIAIGLSVIALILYVITLAPTASLWDCSEFIACGRYLQVGHPPGAPFYLIMLRFASIFAPNAESVAYCCNLLSAVASAAAVGFVYLIAVGLGAKRMASIVAALIFGVCDTFWFSAVESEVYALATLIAALALWSALKFRQTREERWLALIALLLGISIGVHMLCLLVVPAILIITGLKPFRKIRLTATLMVIFAIGTTSYAMIYIRANAHPAINLNCPDTPEAFAEYIKRDAYGHRSPFNRMSGEGAIEQYGYYAWTGYDAEQQEAPTFEQQVKFTLRYQLGYMYLRYLGWNFSGRQNDEYPFGDSLSANWISGIPPIDNYLGPRETLHPDEVNSPARTVFFGIPFLLGIIGICFLVVHSERWTSLAVVGTLFLVSGPLLALYLNMPPYEPRERDYIFVLSFMAYALFIAFGLSAILSRINNKFIPFVFLLIPIYMCAENFTSHDRSGRTVDVDIAKTYLSLCDTNAVLVVEGDNETFPLWYAQQVEHYRPDVEVVNWALTGAPWYVSVYDLVAKSASKPFYFVRETEAISYLGVEKHLDDRGPVLRYRTDTAAVDSLSLIDDYLHNICLPSASTYHLNSDIRYIFENMHLREAANRAASVALNVGNYNQARQILKKSLDIYPIMSAPLQRGNAECLELLHRAEEPELAKMFLSQLTEYYIQALTHYVDLSETNMAAAQMGLDKMRDFARELLDALEATKNTELRSAIINYYEAYEL